MPRVESPGKPLAELAPLDELSCHQELDRLEE